ncbi:hypothetical protein GQS40_09645|uniref:HTH araC/xylS-type domain-containing protein n=1 Tax=Leuconostoc lactis TaxID=1246 RepID=A0A6L7AE64_LEULA|nr:hypothetical protein [Leuconostoc lactis]
MSPFITSIIQYINANVYRPIKVKELARQFNISESKLRTLFKSELDSTVQDFITNTTVTGDTLRSEKNYSNIVFEKLSQTGIECGMDIITAYSSRDLFIKKTELTTTLDEILQVRDAAIVYVTDKVHLDVKQYTTEITDQRIEYLISQNFDANKYLYLYEHKILDYVRNGEVNKLRDMVFKLSNGVIFLFGPFKCNYIDKKFFIRKMKKLKVSPRDQDTLFQYLENLPLFSTSELRDILMLVHYFFTGEVKDLLTLRLPIIIFDENLEIVEEYHSNRTTVLFSDYENILHDALASHELFNFISGKLNDMFLLYNFEQYHFNNKFYNLGFFKSPYFQHITANNIGIFQIDITIYKEMLSYYIYCISLLSKES